MEIPIINRMTEFDPSINPLNNPSLISRIFSIFELGKSSLPHRIWKWGALCLALLYAFSSLAYKIKIIILRYHNKSKSLLASASEPLLNHFDHELYTSDDEDDMVCSSSCPSSSDNDEEEEEPTGSSFEDLTRFDFDFRVKGGGGGGGPKRRFRLRRRRSVVDNFSLSELMNGNGVVKLWENSILGEIPAVSFSPSVVVTGAGEDGVLGLGLWDLRMNWKSAAVQAEWRSDRRSKAVEVDVNRTGKVYVRDEVSRGMVVGDVRKMDTPLEKLTEFEEDTWWDADGVTDTDEMNEKVR